MGVAVDELRVPQDVHEQVAVRDQAVDPAGRERGGELAGRAGPVRRPRDHLGQHGVVVHADDRAALDTAVHADVAGHLEPVQRAACGPPVPRRVLGVEADLDRVAVRRRRFGREPRAFGDGELPGHQVDPEDQLGDRVLDLEAGVDLEEVEVAVGEQELDGAGADVPDRLRGGRGGVVEPLARLGTHRRTRGLLHDLLVPPLDRALPLAQHPHRAVRVGEHLHLDVPGALQQRFAEHRAVAERRLGLAPGTRDGLRQLLLRPDHPHTPATAARGRLDQQREHVGGLGVELGQHRHARRGHPLLRGDLRPHGLDGLRGRPDPGQPGGQHRAGEVGVLGEEPVTGVHRVRPGPQSGVDQQVGAQVRLGRGGAGQPDGRIGLLDVRRVGVRVGVHGDRRDAEVAARADDATGDLAAVRDQQGLDHGHIRKTP